MIHKTFRYTNDHGKTLESEVIETADGVTVRISLAPQSRKGAVVQIDATEWTGSDLRAFMEDLGRSLAPFINVDDEIEAEYDGGPL